jgi:hypothetical protein
VQPSAQHLNSVSEFKGCTADEPRPRDVDASHPISEEERQCGNTQVALDDESQQTPLEGTYVLALMATTCNCACRLPLSGTSGDARHEASRVFEFAVSGHEHNRH